MRRHIDQRALVVLAVDLDQRRAERFQHLHAHRLVVDEGAGAAVGELHAAQDQLVLGRDVVRRQQRAHGMAGASLEGGGHLPLLGPLAHQRGIAARAEREREGIEQDRLAGAGLAGERRQAGAKSMSSRSIRTMSRIESRASMHGIVASRPASGRERACNSFPAILVRTL